MPDTASAQRINAGRENSCSEPTLFFGALDIRSRYAGITGTTRNWPQYRRVRGDSRRRGRIETMVQPSQSEILDFARRLTP
jgi:hypothetical protein